MARFCTNCGAPLQEGASFCTRCGSRVGAPPTSSPQQPLWTPPPAAPKASQPQQGQSNPVQPRGSAPALDPSYAARKKERGKRSGKIYFSLLWVVLILGAALWVLLKFTGNMDKDIMTGLLVMMVAVYLVICILIMILRAIFPGSGGSTGNVQAKAKVSFGRVILNLALLAADALLLFVIINSVKG